MKTAKYVYYGTKYVFWNTVANLIEDTFLTCMIAIVGVIICCKI